MSKTEKLKKAMNERVEEVEYYQFNIDNYRTAIDLLDEKNDPDLQDFRNQLQDLLRTSLIEQKKAQTILDAINKQLES